ncbi:uncharacterized protein LOC110860038 [Folsomia candida]|uniref:uncharacterized protein LOC110860038 n=1 Tax=Folsomia candida TaxID=158441 RepID=UPI000B8FC1F0|nr:uncharacterized protein LOC110860038 [Folsomia candida]XP_021964799.1 uncharacterized protein LOC110860038 [Folsomia candida]XP_021964808.1 uncharacterized protein LOC110860038 [Folsomia candida]
MPGKQDYFPLNLNNMNGGLGFYGEVGPILIPHRHSGKFDANVVHHGSPIAMALHNSPVNATFLSENLMSEYINMNVNSLPPVNSEDEEEEEEEEDDDIVSQSGSESVSVQGSDLDLDVEVMDDVDSLVLNIQDKLRMAAPQYRTSHSASDYCWTDSPSATSTPNSIHSTASNTDNDLLILPQQRSSCTTSTNKSSSGQRKRRTSMNRSWRHSHPNANNSYYRQFHQSGNISKSKKSATYQNQWWSSRSFGDLSKQSNRSKEAYHLLQELLQSGGLIKEAVRRLNRKCFNSSNSGNTIGSGSSSSNNTGSTNNSQDPVAPSNSTASLVVSTSKYSYSSMEDDSDNPFHQHHHSFAPCN